ncbi:hypothetical protein ACGFIR_27890 [Micromonospora sp. NPDC049051]|uniref:hypothetical protein n=1 Tax=Micromonospora sp. NPDC049051 TaxID=3364264 RepID=UPI003715F0CF
MSIWLYPGGHIHGEDVVGVAVEVLADSVVAHGGSRVGVAGGDLYVAEADTGVEHLVANVCRSMCGEHPRHPDSRREGEMLEPVSDGVPVRPPTVGVAQGRPAGALIESPVNGSGDCGWQLNKNELANLAVHA